MDRPTRVWGLCPQLESTQMGGLIGLALPLQTVEVKEQLSPQYPSIHRWGGRLQRVGGGGDTGEAEPTMFCRPHLLYALDIAGLELF